MPDMPTAQVASPLGDLSGHFIICGAEDSFVNFVEQLVRSRTTHGHVDMSLDGHAQ